MKLTTSLHRTPWALFSVALAGGLLTAAISTGCSLTGVVDVEVGKCESTQECLDALNPENGNYADCAAFECRAGKCEPIEKEICDGLDNDCDYLVDEPDDGAANTILLGSAEEEIASGYTTSVDSASVADGGALASIYVQTKTSSGVTGEASVLPASGQGEPEYPVVLANATDFTGGEAKNFDLVEGCFNHRISEDASPLPCPISQVTATSGNSVGFFAFVSLQPCSSGTLRVGVIDPSLEGFSGIDLIDRGRSFRDPTYRGVATDGTECSSNGSEACDAAKAELLAETGGGGEDEARAKVRDECGATRPTIAAQLDRALVSWLGRSASAPACGSETNLLGLMVYEGKGSFGEDFAFANPSDDGKPQVLGSTLGGAAPAVMATATGEGFLIAHGDADNKLTLSYVDSTETLPTNAGNECPGSECESRGYSDPDRPEDNVLPDLRTETFSDPVELLSFSSDNKSAVPDSLRLSLLPLDEDEGEYALLMTWIEGCIDTFHEFSPSPAFARLLHVKMAAGEAPMILDDSFDIVSLGSTTSSPVPIASRNSFVARGLSRDGYEVTPASPSALTQGFYVVTSPDETVAVRLTAFDGQPVVAGEKIAIGDSDIRPLSASNFDTLIAHHFDNRGAMLRTTFSEKGDGNSRVPVCSSN